MRVIVAGSRTINKYSAVKNAINSAFNKWMGEDPEHWMDYYRPEIVSGGALGVDWLGEKYALEYDLGLKIFEADWKQGKKAGILRNIEMGNYADALIAVWDGESRGTKHMIDYMTKLGKPVYVARYNGANTGSGS